MKAVDALYKEKEKAIKVFLDQELEFKKVVLQKLVCQGLVCQELVCQNWSSKS